MNKKKCNQNCPYGTLCYEKYEFICAITPDENLEKSY